MKVIYNGQFISVEDVKISITDRAFNYGDGLFETIIIRNQKLSYLDLHFDRLTRAMETLDLSLPKWLDRKFLEKETLQMIALNKLKTSRIKLQVWRKTGGLYTPQTDQPNVLIMPMKDSDKPPKIKKIAALSSSVRLMSSPYSWFKSINSLPYVLAGMEMKSREVDELIILDKDGNVSECTSSNLFWFSRDSFFTPSLDTGCIAGVRRQYLLNIFQGKGIKFQEVRAVPEVLYQAERLFTTNVTGISWIASLTKRKYQTRDWKAFEKEYNLQD